VSDPDRDPPSRADAERTRGASSFEEAYQTRPPWDIDRPQPAILEAVDRGWVTGNVLETGCGTGENLLHVAERGHTAVGIDVVPTAIAMASKKARERGLDAEFVCMDALDAKALDRRFDTVLDVGLFHVFDDNDREAYVDALETVLVPDGRAIVVSFSDREPGDWGPRRVSGPELREAFAGWTVEAIEPTRFEILDGDVHAWLACMRR